MKSLNKLFALCLALIMCVSLVVMGSCGAKDKDGSEAPIESGEVVFNNTENYEVFDMEGSAITVCGFYGIINTSETATTETGILTVERRKEIEEKYNCTFKMEVLDSQTAVATAMNNGYMADQVYADLFCTFDSSARGMMNQGKLFAASDVIDFSRPQWNAKITKNGTKDGKTYYFSPDATNMESLVMFYPKYLEAYSLENPHELIKQGAWTTDKYLQMCQKITQLGSKNGVYGGNRVTTETSLSSTLALFGTEWVREEDGMYYSNLDDSKIVEALNWQIAVNKTAAPRGATEGTVAVFHWPAGNAGLGVVKPTDDNKYSFCTGPLSKYTTVAPNVCQAANVRAMISLIDQGDDPDRGKKVGTIYSYYCEPLGGSMEEQDKLTRSTWEDRMYDEESVETILAGVKEGGGSMYTWHLGGGIEAVHGTGSWASESSVISAAIINEAGIQSAIDGQKDVLEATLDAVNKANDF